MDDYAQSVECVEAVMLNRISVLLLLMITVTPGCYMYTVGPATSLKIQPPDKGWKTRNNTVYKHGVSVVSSFGRDRNENAHLGMPFMAHICIRSTERLIFDYQNLAIMIGDQKYNGKFRHVNVLWEYDSENFDPVADPKELPASVVTERNMRCFYYEFEIAAPIRPVQIKLLIPRITRVEGMRSEDIPVLVVSYEPASLESCLIPGCFVSH